VGSLNQNSQECTSVQNAWGMSMVLHAPLMTSQEIRHMACCATSVTTPGSQQV
jgi:hypothetical protein